MSTLDQMQLDPRIQMDYSKESALDVEEALFFQQMCAAYDKQLEAIHVLPSHNRTSSLSPAKGYVGVFQANAQLDVDFVGERMHTYTMLKELTEEQQMVVEDLGYTEAMNAMEGVIKQTTHNKPNMSIMNIEKPTAKNQCLSSSDDGNWEPSLGNNGHIGLYKKTLSRGKAKYYLSVTSEANELGFELWKFANNHYSDMTIKQFVQSAENRFVDNIAQRNCKKLLKLASDALSLGFSAITDHTAFEPENDTKLVNPDIIIHSNYFETKQSGGKERAYFYSHCSSLSEFVGEAFVVNVDPWYGAQMIVGQHGKKLYSKICNVMPTGTARVVARKDAIVGNTSIQYAQYQQEDISEHTRVLNEQKEYQSVVFKEYGEFKGEFHRALQEMCDSAVILDANILQPFAVLIANKDYMPDDEELQFEFE